MTADVVYAPMESEKDFDTWKGKLKGKIVMPMPTREVKAQFEAPGKRYSEKDLQELEQIEPRADAARRRFDPAQFQFARKRLEFLISEGVLATFEPGRGDGGTIFVQQGGAYSSAPPSSPFGQVYPGNVPPQIVIAVEHYGRLARTLDKKVPVTVELNVKNTFTTTSRGSTCWPSCRAPTRPTRWSCSADTSTRGTGDRRHRQRRGLGDHDGSDAHPEGVGSQDAAHGAPGALERRGTGPARLTRVRERQVRRSRDDDAEAGTREAGGLLQRRQRHRRDSRRLPAGQRGRAPIFSAWMKPFANLGMTTLSMQNTGGTDHLSFDAVGLPGFQFIQDPLEYETRTHHTNMDNYERLQSADVMKNAVIVATFVYQAANREARLPRKPLPKPQPPAVRPGPTTTNR